MSLFRALSLSTLLLPVSLAAVVQERQTACSDVHLFLARGNGEAYPGRVGAMSNTVCNGLPSCDSENIEFNSNQAYCSQASDGVSSGISQITAYASACPNAKLVLAGYSLGAQIVGDILGGAGGSFYDCQENTIAALDSSLSSRIAAITIFGDVRHVANEPYNVGTGSGSNGQYPRSGGSLSSLDSYSSKIQSYCLTTDPICALGNDGLSHETYMTVFADQAGAWVQSLLGYAPAGSPSSSPSPSPSASASSSTGTSAPSSTGSSSVESGAAATSSSSEGSSEGSSGSSTGSASGSSTSSASGSSETSSTDSSSSSSSSSESSSNSFTVGVPTGTVSTNTASFSAFEFVNTATVATTSTYVHTTPKSTLAFTGVPTPSISASIAILAPTSASVSSSKTTSGVNPASTNGAISNQVSLTLVSLLVIKVLAF